MKRWIASLLMMWPLAAHAQVFLTADEKACIPGGKDRDWWWDRAEVPQLVRLGILNDALGDATTAATSYAKLGAYTVMVDVDALDKTKLEAELASAKPVCKDVAHKLYADVAQRAAHYREVLAEARGKDADLEAVVTAAEQGTKDWFAAYAKEKAAFDAMWAFEDAARADESKIKDCSKPLRAAWEAHLAAAHPATDKDLRPYSADLVMYPLEWDLMWCAVIEDHPMTALAYSELTGGSSTRERWRGPRTAALIAAQRAIQGAPTTKKTAAAPRQLRRGRPFSVVDPNMIYNEIWGRAVRSTSAISVQSGAHVDKLARQGTTTTVTFQKWTWKHPEVFCKETDKIDRIINGTVFYQQDCKATGKTLTETYQEKPIQLEGKLGDALKHGMSATFRIDAKDRSGVPFLIYKDREQKQLAGILGYLW
jgi:hypothetical protein